MDVKKGSRFGSCPSDQNKTPHIGGEFFRFETLRYRYEGEVSRRVGQVSGETVHRIVSVPRNGAIFRLLFGVPINNRYSPVLGI